MQKRCGGCGLLRRALALVAVGAFAFFVVGAGQAATSQVECGDVITQDTKLDHDLIDCSADGLIIGADNITLDLNGHTIDGIGSASPFGSSGIDNSRRFDGVRIIEGSVVDFPVGIDLVGTTENVLRQLDVSGNVSMGIFVDGFAGGDSAHNRIVDNRVSNNLGDGIFLRGSDENTISKNEMNTNGGRGLILAYGATANAVEANSVLANGHQGIFLSSAANGNELKGNSVAHNRLGGIAIVASSRNHVVGNDISAHIWGVLIDSYRGQSSNENMLVRNRLRGNGDGILVYGDSNYPVPFPGVSDTVILGNEAEANGDDGIDVRSESTLISRNKANNNGDLGIEAVPGVIDGGGNRAIGNGNTLQCVNVVCS